MASAYYKPCPELDRCNALIDQYWYSGQYDLCFRGHLELAEQGYPLAECQVGYFYLKGLGVCQDFERAAFWTERAARHGDWDAQYNLGTFYEQGIGVTADLGQHRTIWQEHSAKDFASYESYKRAGILYVFPPFITARMGQKIGRRPQTQLCGDALEQAKLWYQAAARQGHTLAQQKCEALFPDHSRETE